MDDGQLWQEMRDGAPVAHCRAKIAHEQAQMIDRRNKRALADWDRRRGSRAKVSAWIAQGGLAGEE